MAPVRARLRADLRLHWRAWAGLVLLVGLLGGVVLAAAAAARRTETAFPRLLAASRAPDALISPQENALGAFNAEIARLPDVAALGEMAGVPLARLDAAGQIDPLLASPPVSVDGRTGYSVYRPNVLAGRMPRADRAGEVLATTTTADRLHLRVGSRVSLVALSRQENDASAYDPRLAHRRFSFTVVGVGVFADTLTGGGQSPTDNLLLSPAWYRAYGDPGNLSYTGALVRLRPGADVARLRQQVDEIARRHPEAGGAVFFSTYADRYAAEQRAIRPQAIALWLFAGLAAAAALLVLGQALSRTLVGVGGDRSTLRALGMSRGQLLVTSVLPAAAIAAAGAVLAVALAVAASPLGPVGPARLAEPHPGVAVNLAVLGLGAGAIVVLLAAWVAVPAWRADSAAQRPADARADARPSRLVAAVARRGQPSAAAGIRMALEAGGGRTAVPVRSALVGGTLAVAALVAATSFVADLAHLVSTPRLYGTTWDLSLDGQFSSFPKQQGLAVIDAVPGVRAVAGGVYGNVTIAGQAIAAVGLDGLRGQVFPTVLEGRAPRGPNEIVLGTNTLHRAHRVVGQVVRVVLPSGSRRMRVVGRAVFPGLGRGSFAPTDLGDGAATTVAALAGPDVPRGSYNFFLVRLAPGTDVAMATTTLGRLATQAGCPPGQCPSFTPRPADIDNYDRVRSTPLLLAGLLAALAVATVGHALVTSVRRRRRDLAILKTLGFLRRQVCAAVAWQATTLVTLALVVGVPLGLAAGRWGWALFAHQLGVAPESLVPVTALLVIVPGAIVVANLISALPARAAGRTRPAAVLRAE